MNLAVLKYMYTSYQPEGMPDEWPAEVRELGSGTTLPGQDWVLMTNEEYEAHRGEYQEDYDTWWEANRPQD